MVRKQLGTEEHDLWSGTDGANRFVALAGNDRCFGRGGNDVISGGAGDDTIDGDAGDDRIKGDSGNDTLNGNAGNDRISGGAGDDHLRGGSGNDTLKGGAGNDFMAGDTGDDVMIGGTGNDVLDWDDGDGSDTMLGGLGRDTIEVDGSVTRGDHFVLGRNAAGRAFFERVSLDGQLIGQFTLTVSTSEIFDVSGDGGNDTFIINDLTGTGVELVQFSGDDGDDLADGRHSSTPLQLDGGSGNDTLIGGVGTMLAATGATLGDTLTGGIGHDQFTFATNPFTGALPGQNVNQPAVITDYEIGIDRIAFDRQAFGLNRLEFQQGNVTQFTGNQNLLVLEGTFANAGEAAQAIANNDAITANRGVFVYFNRTLGISRVVFSQDLANGGPISVVANLANSTNSGNQALFSANDFSLV
ncbi:calcium-binding protein [Thermocoleostomius sinensis]|uniref:Calcium-binding protein n=1 Tax=Thermocoleostomius sinensis A174 TaxID=2016057 RepID=A0A9E9C8F0_9CYAN|nr:calcium-binding protein [Thermocoleostomius sinensis]WAL60243.1 calcium-binding protein [Thermocoleostomius sinensis A174]